MAIAIIEYNRRLQGVINDLQSGAHGQVMTQIAENAITYIRDRVQEKGLNPEGGQYKDYSLGYKRYKEKKGKYKGFVDFTFSGRMFNNIKLVSPKDELDQGIAVIKATTQEDAGKLQKNTLARGDILMVSKQELEQLKKDYEQGILDIFRKNQLL